jgi:ribosome-binding factor A
MSDARRAQRVAEAIKLHLASVLQRELGDPLLAALVVTDVDVAADLSNARVSVRLLSGDEDLERRKSALRSLARAGGRIRRGLAPRLRLRRFPELHFAYDTGHDASRRIEQLLSEIAEQGRGGEPED